MVVHNPKYFIGASRIKFTYHSRDRFLERLNLKSLDDLRKVAANARNKGVNLNSVNITNYEHFGMTYPALVAFKRYFKSHNKSERIYYYKDYVFIFCGKDSCTLKTVVPLREMEMKNPEPPTFR